jgi:hypothetical protein
MELLVTWDRSMVFSFISRTTIKEKTIDLSQVTNNSIVTVKCRTTIKEKTIDLSQVTNNSIVTVRCRTIIKEKTIFTVTMELLVIWDRSMVFSFIVVLHLTVTMELLVTNNKKRENHRPVPSN